MRRRRLVPVIGTVALVTALAAWWVSANRLSADEERLVGTWILRDPEFGDLPFALVLERDRRCLFLGETQSAAPPTCRWSVRGNTIVLDYEPSPCRRLVRPLAQRLSLDVGTVHRWPVAVTADQLTITYPDLDWAHVFRRVRAD